MTLDELKHVLEVSVNRPDLSESYGDWVNEALLGICQDVSYNCMRTSVKVTISAGSSFASLPADFKELTKPRSPINVRNSDNSTWIPVDVTRREDIIRVRSTFLTPIPTTTQGATQVFLSNNGDSWTLNMLDTVDSATLFDVSYFRLLPPLTGGDESNYLTRTYISMVKAKVRAVGFGEINDPLAGVWESAYANARKLASADDAMRFIAGRRMQMGG